VTDSKLRELERRWKESGRVDDEAAYLLGRMRVGDLERRMLELAAYSGHHASIRAIDSKATEEHHSIELFVKHICQWGPKAGVRAAVAAEERVAYLWSSRYPTEKQPKLAASAAL